MQVEDEVAHTVTDEPADDAPNERFARDRDGRFGPDEREWLEARAEASGQHHGVGQWRSAASHDGPNTMSVAGTPRC